MIKVDAPRFDVVECRDERERDFVEAIHSRAEAGSWFADVWPRDNRFVLTVCPGDSEYNCVLRTLRIDFDGIAVSFGPDETHQLVTDLDPARPGVSVMSGRPPAELALSAAIWLEQEMRRPIVRREWNRPTFQRREWLLADTGEGLVVSDSANAFRRDGLSPPGSRSSRERGRRERRNHIRPRKTQPAGPD